MVSSIAAAQSVETVVVEMPERSVIQTATIGSTIYENSNYRTLTATALVPEAEMTKGWIGWRATIPAGSALMIEPHKKYIKACADGMAHNTISGIIAKGCAYDRDKNGTLDRISVAGGSAGEIEETRYFSKELKTRISGNGFENLLIFTGFSKATLKLSYREFVNDFARPAFTQALEFDVSELPTIISVKNL
jgi:hypothetical protein